MIANVTNSTSIMHAKPRPSLQCLNLTTSRSFDVIAGRCGGREAWTAPPVKVICDTQTRGHLPHAEYAHISAANIQSDVCVQITVSCGALTIEVSQPVNQEQRKMICPFPSLSLSLHETFLSLYPNNYCQCSTWSLVSRQLLPEGSAAPSSPFDKRSAIAEPLNAILVFH